MRTIKTFENNKYKFFKWGDLILIAILIVSIVLTCVFANKEQASQAQVYIDGKLKYSLDLSVDKEIEILDGAMTLVVENNSIKVKESNCPEQVCVHSSSISIDGGMIICLPNKVVIKVTTSEVDAIS